MISRFRTAKEQKEILELAEQGKVDVLIGTNRDEASLFARDKPPMLPTTPATRHR